MSMHSIDPQDTDGGVTAAAIEKEANGVPFSEHLGKLSIASHQAEQAEKDAAHFRALAKKAEDRAEKAESKLGEAVRLECPDLDAHWRLDDARMTIKEQQDLIDALRADLARAEAINREITNEMVERGWTSISPTLREALSRHTIRRILETALIEPQRPHGAQELTPVVEEMLETYWRGDLNGEDVPDFLAERGVRLTEKEQS